MVHVKSVSDFDIFEKHVLVRADLEWEGQNSPREQATKEIIRYLQQQGAARIKIIGHKGSISQVEELGVDVFFDLRADPREEANATDFAMELAQGFDVYINEAFATSHRIHASLDALPRFMKESGKPVGIGPRFKKELEMLESALTHKGKKVLIIGGAKTGDKAGYADSLEGTFDVVLRGGLLPGTDLRKDGLDISDAAISEYVEECEGAEVIVVAGPVGKYEDESAARGTRDVYEAVVGSGAYTVAGGGDTEAAIEKFGLRDQFDWISVGGGAMLHYFSSGSLPALESLLV